MKYMKYFTVLFLMIASASFASCHSGSCHEDPCYSSPCESTCNPCDPCRPYRPSFGGIGFFNYIKGGCDHCLFDCARFYTGFGGGLSYALSNAKWDYHTGLEGSNNGTSFDGTVFPGWNASMTFGVKMAKLLRFEVEYVHTQNNFHWKEGELLVDVPVEQYDHFANATYIQLLKSELTTDQLLFNTYVHFNDFCDNSSDVCAFDPYVGFSLGATYNRLKEVRSFDAAELYTYDGSSGSKTQFTWGASVGAWIHQSSDWIWDISAGLNYIGDIKSGNSFKISGVKVPFVSYQFPDNVAGKFTVRLVRTF